MVLQEFKSYIEKFPDNHLFSFGISNPFSSRENDINVAFTAEDFPMRKEEILQKIESALTETFSQRGGEIRFDENFQIKFEDESGDYDYEITDYCAHKIAEIEGSEVYGNQEEKLIKIAFN